MKLHLTIEQIRLVLRFIGAGICVALFQYVSFYVLFALTGLLYIIASTISFCLTIIVSFFVQKFYTFRHLGEDQTKSAHRAFIFFAVNALFGLVLNGVVMKTCVSIFFLSPYSAQFVSMVILAIYNYFVYQLILR